MSPLAEWPSLSERRRRFEAACRPGMFGLKIAGGYIWVNRSHTGPSGYMLSRSLKSF